MATLEVEGFEDLEDALQRISEIPFPILGEALDAMAETAAAKIREEGMSMGVRDPESEVHILDVIKPRTPKQTDSGGYQDITFSGSRRRHGKSTRNAEIAFVNEYGRRGQPARPFIGNAMTKNENTISAAGEKIIGDWIESEFQRN